MVLDNPVVVIEVVSPSSERSDTGAKVADYFRVSSIRHYLIIDPYGRSVIRHSRPKADGLISTEVHLTGEIKLDPPGLTVAAEDLLGSEVRAPLEKKS
jgi:Uma2 family endonuclease